MYRNVFIELSNFRQLIAEVSAHPLAARVRRHGTARLRLNFKTGTREVWFRERILEAKDELMIPYDPFAGEPLEIGPQYECDPLSTSTLQKMKMIRYKRWKLGSFYRRRMIIQEFLHLLLQDGYVHLEFPHAELTAELNNLWKDDVWWRHTLKGCFLVYGKYGDRVAPGRKMVEQFTSWGENGVRNLREAWESPPRLYRAITCLLNYQKDVTRHSVMCTLSNTIYSNRRARVRFICPNVYRAIFKRFDVANMVIADPYPGFGSKAIAATLEGCHYHSSGDFSELGGFLGVEFGALDRDSYDAVILDYDWTDPGQRLISDLKVWARRADLKIVFVPKSMVGLLPPPAFSVKIETNFLLTGSPDFVYCYT